MRQKIASPVLEFSKYKLVKFGIVNYAEAVKKKSDFRRSHSLLAISLPFLEIAILTPTKDDVFFLDPECSEEQ